MTPRLNPEQARATDPLAHAALSASAGTGKTHVLTSRVFRLLLRGARPESILCLTFTKAGASAMAERIGERLAHWVRLPRPELFNELEALGEAVTPQMLDDARRLFARVLDTPGGLRIQTIHSFAQSLLAAFPAEAGVSPGFKPIEGRAADELALRTLADLVADAESKGDAGLIADVAALSRRLGERGAVDYLRACAAKARAIEQIDPTRIEGELRNAMGLIDCDVDQYLTDHCGDDRFDCALLRAIADANRGWGGKSGQGYAAVIEAWLAMAPADRARALPILHSIVATQKGEPRKVTKGQLDQDPAYQVKSDALAEAVGALLAMQNGCALAADLAAGLRAGRAFALAYSSAKRAAGVADFNDLIDWANTLLKQEGMAEWVRFKLDQRIDHLLVDEAQDTNSDQWSIIRALVEDFFSGAAEADGRWRTLLTVGDFKQAIFGFQGTDPRAFESVRRELIDKAETARAIQAANDDGQIAVRQFHDLTMATSFRSAQGVLDAVDAMIDVVGHEAMGLERAPEAHRAAAHNAGLPATVELWRPFAPALRADEQGDGEDEEGWIDLRERRYAERLAAQVKAWIASGLVLGSTGEAITPGDIMILVRSRGELAALIVARLFAAGVPVAGIDRLHLQEPLAVQDLLAAMGFAVQPLDDLNLANLLVSPLIGWSQDELRSLAGDRNGQLWPALRDQAKSDPRAAEAQAVLNSLLAMADYVTPARFVETVLTGSIDGRRKLAHRLTLASRDPIDELMSSALQFERDDIASLERFLAWFRRGDVEIARDSSAPANEVRVMTVHGAKGLEAPVVILADAHLDPARQGRQNAPFNSPVGGATVPIIRPRKAELVAPFAEEVAGLQAAALEEHWRLLYVGLTRAIDHLVIAGLEPKSGAPVADSWHAKMSEAMDRLGAKPEADILWTEARRYRVPGSPRAASKGKGRATLATAGEVPDWARRAAPTEQRPPRPLSPSAIATDDLAGLPPTPALRAAARRGTLIHALLERLVDVLPAQRRSVALQWLDRSAGVAEAEVRADLADQVCGILSDDRFHDLFGPGSLGEAPLAATLPDGRVIAGTVDRLLVEDERVSVIDFKTGRVPAGEGAIPPAHLAQMAANADALAVIFPGRAIHSALLYTAGPVLFELTG